MSGSKNPTPENTIKQVPKRSVVDVFEKTSDVLACANMGMWYIVLEEGAPKMFMDKTMNLLVGNPSKATPEEAYSYWISRVDPDYLSDAQNAVAKMLTGEPAEVTYPYTHPWNGRIMVRCGGVLDSNYAGPGKRLKGYHQDISVYNKTLLEKASVEHTAEMKVLENRSEEFLELLNQVVGTGMWYFDFDENGNVINVNWSDHVRKMLGMSEEEFTPSLETWSSLVHPEDYQVAKDEWLKNINNETNSYVCKERVRLSNGKYEWFLLQGKTARYENGKPRLIFGTITNITLSENEAYDMRNRISALAGGIKGGLVIYRMGERNSYEYISEEAAAIQGYTPAEFLHRVANNAIDNIYIVDRDRIINETTEAFSKGDTFAFKYRVLSKDGSIKWVNEFGQIQNMPDGNRYIYSLLQDITEEENLNQTLFIERKQFREALIKSSDYYFEFDLTDGYMREEMSGRIGAGRMSDMGLTLPVSYDDECKAFISTYGVTWTDERCDLLFSNEGLMALYREGVSMEEFEYYMSKSDRYYKAMLMLSENLQNKHVNVICFCTDITEAVKEKKEAEKKLKNALRRAEAANRAKTTFLNNMSHDIRTPMNAIIGYTTLAETHVNDTEKALDYLNKIKTSSAHLLSLINDVLDMSRIESGKVQIETAKVSVVELMNDLRNMISPDTAKKNQKLVFELENIKNENVWCDRLHLNQVLINCLSNAIKFTPEGGTIGVKAIQSPCEEKGIAAYQFKVSDTGIGMSPDFIEKIFDPFEREQSSTVSGIQGTGLGMAISKSIVDLMGGDISVASEKGKGSEFTVSLKLKIASSAPIPEPTAKEIEAAKPLSELSILLVEDNELNLEIASELLTEAGAKVDKVTDGIYAVEKLQSAKPGIYDLVLMDIQMPIMGGYEATKKIRSNKSSHYSNIPIIAMTANAFEEDRKAAFKAGMNEHIAKPIDVNTIVETINRVLNSK